jgi:hypothetical protein
VKLAQQCGFLCVSAQAFDAGFEAEAQRLAATCRVLFMPAGRVSLMYQIGAHRTLTLPDTANFDFHGGVVQLQGERDGEPYHTGEAPGGLTILSTGRGDARFAAPFDTRMDEAEWVPLKTWLNRVAVRGSAGITHSRRDFIDVLANQEGGTHVDPTVDEAYMQLRTDVLGILLGAPQVEKGPDGTVRAAKTLDLGRLTPPDSNIVEASMRQIAHEVLRALEKHFPDLPHAPRLS